MRSRRQRMDKRRHTRNAWEKAQKLKRLPASILKLTALERLDLSNNALDDVPEPVLSLEKLKSLDLTGNDLRSRLPRLAKLAKLPDLEELRLGYHLHWKTLPTELFGLTRLRRLDLSWLTIKTIPDELSRLSELEALDLSSCTGLKKLPSAVLELRKLRRLTLSGSPIGTVPTGIDKTAWWYTARSFRHCSSHVSAARR